MVREGGEANVVVQVEALGVPVAFRGIGGPVYGEGFRNLAHVGVQDTVQALGPYGGELAVGVLDHGVHIAFEHGVQLSLHGKVIAVLQAGVRFLVHQAVGLGHVQDIAKVRAGGEVELAIQAYELLGAVCIGLAYHEHFREIRIQGRILDALGLDGLRLQERQGAEAPAGAAAVLVLDGGDGILLDNSELVICRFYRGGRTLGAGADDGQGGEGGGNNVLFHVQINLITYKIKDYILILQP